MTIHMVCTAAFLLDFTSCCCSQHMHFPISHKFWAPKTGPKMLQHF